MLSAMRGQTSVWLLTAGLAAIVGLADFGALAQERTSGAPRERLNVVVAIADDWSWPHTGVDGDPAVRTLASTARSPRHVDVDDRRSARGERRRSV